MGRKKRKIADDEVFEDEIDEEQVPEESASAEAAQAEPEEEDKKKSSGYAMTSHSGEILHEDVYVSDGSESETEDLEVVLVGSRMGVMRRGLAAPTLVQPNRQWQRATEAAPEETEEEQKRKEEEELANLDPAARAARLLQEKQRKLEEAKELARRVESEENAGRDPALFSKRTAFDIRFDQIEDKPWTRGTGDMADFFNYNLSEEDWLAYAQQQIQIRQELMDASRQKRAPDPNIVPVTGKARKAHTAGTTSTGEEEKEGEDQHADNEAPDEESEPAIGPALPENKGSASTSAQPSHDKKAAYDVYVGEGGAWGAGAPPDSKLAQLIEAQERGETPNEYDDEPPRGDDGHHGYGDEDDNASRYTDTSDRAGSNYGGDYAGYRGGGAGGRGGWQDRGYPPGQYGEGYRGRGGRGYGGRGAPGWGGRGGWSDRGEGDYYDRKRPRDGDPRWRR